MQPRLIKFMFRSCHGCGWIQIRSLWLFFNAEGDCSWILMKAASSKLRGDCQFFPWFFPLYYKMNSLFFRYKTNALFNIGTFLLFRILTLGWMTRWLTVNRDNIPLAFFTIGSIGLAVIVSIIYTVFLLFFSLYLGRLGGLRCQENSLQSPQDIINLPKMQRPFWTAFSEIF